MKYYLAPLETITNYTYRKVYTKYFKGIDKVFIPFLNPYFETIQYKDSKELDIENNKLDIKVVPQIISRRASDTIWLINKLVEQGYDEVNLNFGCPSSTIVAKGKGSGILKDLDYLDNYLKEVFENTSIKISIKIRLGVKDENEFIEIIKILNKYPIYELIIHPRTSKEKYAGRLHLDFFSKIESLTNIDIIYNGEVKTIEDIDTISCRFSFIKGIMLGRGLIASPDMLAHSDNELERIETIKSFYYELIEEYKKDFGYENALVYIKQIWTLLIHYFDVDKETKTKLFASINEKDINEVIELIFSNYKINQHIENGIK